MEGPIPMSALRVGRRYRIRHRRYPGETEVGRFVGAIKHNDKIVGANFNEIQGELNPITRMAVGDDEWIFTHTTHPLVGGVHENIKNPGVEAVLLTEGGDAKQAPQ